MHRIERATLMHKWESLLEEEDELFSRAADLDRVTGEKTNEKSEIVRQWWGVVNAILWMIVRTKAQHDLDLTPLPAFTLGRLANMAEELSNGNVPSFITDAGSSGRPMWRVERHYIAFGILYIEAAKRGEILDKSYNKTVRQAYNVTSHTNGINF